MHAQTTSQENNWNLSDLTADRSSLITGARGPALMAKAHFTAAEGGAEVYQISAPAQASVGVSGAVRRLKMIGTAEG